MLAALCVAEEDIIITVLEQWRGARDKPPAGTGTHLPRSDCPPSHSITGVLLAPCTKLHLDPASPHHTAHGAERWKRERQTAKAWQSAGPCSRAAPDGTAWMWALTSRCQKTPSPILFLQPGLWGAEHNLLSHLPPRDGSSSEGWPSCSSGAAQAQHWPFAAPRAWWKGGGAAGSSPCAGAPPGWALGWGCCHRPGTSSLLCWCPAVLLTSLPGAGSPPWCCSALWDRGLGGVPVFADDFRLLQIKFQPSPALPRCASSLHPGFSGIPVSFLAFPGGCVRAALKPSNQA